MKFFVRTASAFCCKYGQRFIDLGKNKIALDRRVETRDQITLMRPVVSTDEGTSGITADAVGQRPFTADSFLKCGKCIFFIVIIDHFFILHDKKLLCVKNVLQHCEKLRKNYLLLFYTITGAMYRKIKNV